MFNKLHGAIILQNMRNGSDIFGKICQKYPKFAQAKHLVGGLEVPSLNRFRD